MFYMGLHRLPSIAQSLISAGKAAETPTCVVSRATTPRQRTVLGTLAEISTLAKAADLHAPSLVIVGECVRLREQTQWFEQRPLFGQVVGIPRPEDQADATALRLIEYGGEPVLLPTIEIGPPENWTAVDAAVAELKTFDWVIFTSVNGVHGLMNRLWETGGDARALGNARLATIGPSTAAALTKYSLKADLVPTEYRAEALAAELKPHVFGKRLLWVRASRGRDVLPAELAAAGATVQQVIVYQNRDVDEWPQTALHRIENGELDWIALSSPSIARNLARLLSDQAKTWLGGKTKLASISPVTTAAAIEVGLPIAAEATDYTWEGLLQAMIHRSGGFQPPL